MTDRCEELDQSRDMLMRLRSRLRWLVRDGYQQTDVTVLASRFHVTFRVPHAQVTITGYPGMSDLEVWLRPAEGAGPELPMQHCLELRGLTALSQRIDGSSVETVHAAIDAHAAALKQLRQFELAGDWGPGLTISPTR